MTDSVSSITEKKNWKLTYHLRNLVHRRKRSLFKNQVAQTKNTYQEKRKVLPFSIQCSNAFPGLKLDAAMDKKVWHVHIVVLISVPLPIHKASR